MAIIFFIAGAGFIGGIGYLLYKKYKRTNKW